MRTPDLYLLQQKSGCVLYWRKLPRILSSSVGQEYSEMTLSRRLAGCVFQAALLGLLVQPAFAQSPKELRARPGVAVVMVSLVNPRADCSVNPVVG